MASIRSWVSERSCSAANLVSTAIVANDVMTMASIRSSWPATVGSAPGSETSMREPYLIWLVVATNIVGITNYSTEVIMKAAVVSSFDAPPRYQDFPDPVPAGDDDMVVDVLAAGLHPRVRSQADGSHYTSTGEMPLVPGIDGVGRGADGRLRYFILPDTTLGAMAEQSGIDPRRSVVLPSGSAPVAVAAAMNPAMSSWVALRRRVQFRAGQSVLILGATGSAGQMAIQIAELSGAGRIIAAGRNAERLARLPAAGATGTVSLDGDPEVVARQLGQIASEGDGVIDYPWGE